MMELLLAILPFVSIDMKPRQYQARLLDSIGSMSPAGHEFTLRIVGPLSRSTPGALPRGAMIRGRVRRTRPVGLGFFRDRASLEIEFSECASSSGEGIPCEVELAAVDNGRERVKKANAIQGISAASHPHSLVRGFWIRPEPATFGRSTIGLTGLAGAAQAKFIPAPVAAGVVIGVRTLLFRLPEPEVNLPAGADLILRVTHAPLDAPGGPLPRGELHEELREELRLAPVDVRHADRSEAADIVNLAFVGSLPQVESAFRAAGWAKAESTSARTCARTYRAFSAMNTYAAAPVSPLTYQGRLPATVFQKSLNTLAKRHHIRLWPSETEGAGIWLGAATHDIGIVFEWNRLGLNHRIDPRIDRERNTVLNDLQEAGCVASIEQVDRQELRSSAGRRVTDGALAVVHLQECDANLVDVPKAARRGLLYSTVRRIVLESRHYVTQGNPYHYAYQAFRWRKTKEAESLTEDY